MKQFEHPNLLPCLTSLVVGGQVWVVTPLAEWARSVDLLHIHLYVLLITVCGICYDTKLSALGCRSSPSASCCGTSATPSTTSTTRAWSTELSEPRIFLVRSC